MREPGRARVLDGLSSARAEVPESNGKEGSTRMAPAPAAHAGINSCNLSSV